MNKKEKLSIIIVVLLVVAFIITLITSIIVGNIEAKKSLDNLKNNIKNIARVEIYENGNDEKKTVIMEDIVLDNIISNLQKAKIVKNDKTENLSVASSVEYRVLFMSKASEIEGYYSFENNIMYLDDYNLEGSFKALDEVISPLVVAKQDKIMEEFANFLKDNKDIKKGITDYEVKKNNLYITYNDSIQESELSDIINKIKNTIPSINGVITNPEEDK